MFALMVQRVLIFQICSHRLQYECFLKMGKTVSVIQILAVSYFDLKLFHKPQLPRE